MCLAIPAQLVERINDRESVVAWSDMQMTVCTELVPDVKEGDWVLVHTGYIIEVIDPQEAAESIALFREIMEHEQTP